MASRYMASLASRARTFRKSHIFLQQSQRPQRPRQSVLLLALGSRSYSGGFLKSWYEKFDPIPTNICVAIGGISGFLGAAFAYYNWGSWDETTRQSTAYNTLKERFKCHLPANPVAREDLISSMLMAITPTAEARGYRLIVGEDGTGKSTLVALALERLGETKGVVYIETWILDALGSSFNFANAMKKALGLKPNPIDNPPLTVHDGWEIFSDFAAKYKQEHGKIPVLIIDNADRLAKSKPEILDALQDYAKEATDERTATVVFVSGEGFLPRMRARSAMSRCGMILEVGDIGKEEALKYLGDRGIKGEQASQIYELYGGRIVHLDRTVNQMQIDPTFQRVKSSAFTEARWKLFHAGIDPAEPKHVSVIRELLKERGPISRARYFDILGSSLGEKLLEGNAFTDGFGTTLQGRVDFKSTMIRRYCEQEWGREGKGARK
ncbi:MAG: hypothetical protein M1813_000010 [Trichoglossum hirsutum]|nr:MAG: hypothetical protein M1813_000010 [Trichoglossum hirsutum]